MRQTGCVPGKHGERAPVLQGCLYACVVYREGRQPRSHGLSATLTNLEHRSISKAMVCGKGRETGIAKSAENYC
jgi:hypothetical protein